MSIVKHSFHDALAKPYPGEPEPNFTRHRTDYFHLFNRRCVLCVTYCVAKRGYKHYAPMIDVSAHFKVMPSIVFAICTSRRLVEIKLQKVFRRIP